MTRIHFPRHYPRQQQFEIGLMFNRLVDVTCKLSGSRYPAEMEYYVYLNEYDIIEESKYVKDESILNELSLATSAEEHRITSCKDDNGKDIIVCCIFTTLETGIRVAFIELVIGIFHILRERDIVKNLNDRDLVDLSNDAVGSIFDRTF